MTWPLWALCALTSVASATSPLQNVQPYAVTGDAIEKSLTGQAGDAKRGAELIQQRHKSLCVLCHSGPFPDPHLQGTLAPDLTGIGERLSAGQLRLRIVDTKRLNPASIMPTYYGVIANDKDTRVADGWRNKPVLTAEEIEDLVAYLQTLRR
ncbi:sulfur oxidation c-type cytochrome SoxX [Steroidobacter cummioxidans]|uniref:sulfur oxidation c-type cytochrome SoxX n=1 Tax=Steroidobacter cummioxidans TaxID=1803913 RepID=UPI000E30D9D8|nr:sulfur oxidation c-type cytochrome SoxX [Steroidobacter cummioxidans]